MSAELGFVDIELGASLGELVERCWRLVNTSVCWVHGFVLATTVLCWKVPARHIVELPKRLLAAAVCY